MTTLQKSILIAIAIVLPWLIFSPVERLFYAIGAYLSLSSSSLVRGLLFMLYVMWDMLWLAVLIHVVGNSLHSKLEK